MTGLTHAIPDPAAQRADQAGFCVQDTAHMIQIVAPGVNVAPNITLPADASGDMVPRVVGM